MDSVISLKCFCLLLVSAVLSQVASQAPNTKTPLKLATLLQPPLVMRDHKTGEYSGFFVEVLDQMGYSLSHVNTIINNSYALEDHPEKQSDALKEVADGRSDIAIVALDSENRKSEGVTFSHAVFNLGFIGLYKMPEDWTPSYSAMMTLIEPFSPGLWCLIIFMAVLSSGVLFFLRWLSPFEANHKQEPTTARSNSFMYMFASLMGQSSADAPRSFSARVVACVWWVFSLMTAGAYMAGLLAILLRMNPHVRTLPFGSVDEMAKQTEVDVITVSGGSTYNFFSRHEGRYSSRLWDMWKKRMDQLLVPSMDVALKRLEESDGKVAVFMLEVTALHLANSIPCDKMVVAEPVGDLFYGFACKKGAHLCEDLDHAILDMKEKGEIEKLEIRWLEKVCRDGMEYFYEGHPYIDTFGVGDPNWLSPMTMTIKRFSGAFVMLIIGFAAAFLVLLAEILYTRWRGKSISVPRRGHDDLQGINDH